ncbi:MAG: hypothetical protein PHU85_01905 [Phycisphaerae bacterium]|nr:hypothetical protein [Phycisphaerae bacterium]
MNANRITILTAAALMAVVGCSTYAAAPANSQVSDFAGTYAYVPNPSAWPDADQSDLDAPGADPLVQGPVHEAFATPIASDPADRLVVQQAPPQPIAEVPPDEKPVGDNVVWIPGYWSWDADRAGFIWVSGLWRDVPPGMRWEPGYWSAVDGGFTWVSGFWAPAAVNEFQYLPAPPVSVEDQPITQPSPDSIWSPGYWNYNAGRYVWQSGGWMNGQADWNWIPPHYVRTPRGFIFVRGYWDYRLERRGMLFAPVCFDPSVYQQPQFVFSPTIVININVLVTNLFVQPRQRHYLFGDYYDPGCARAGIYPLVDYSRQAGRFDPIYTQQRWDHRRDDPRWDEHQRTAYEQRRDNKSIRPPRTFAAQQTELKRNPRLAQDNLVLAKPIRDVTAGRTLPMRTEKLTPASREKFLTQSRDLARNQAQRVRQEVSPTRPTVNMPNTTLTAPKPLRDSSTLKDTRNLGQPLDSRQFKGATGPGPVQPAVTLPDSRRVDTRAVTTPRTITGPTNARDTNSVIVGPKSTVWPDSLPTRTGASVPAWTAPASKTPSSFSRSNDSAVPTRTPADAANRLIVTPRNETTVPRVKTTAIPNTVSPFFGGRTSGGRAETIKAPEPRALPTPQPAGISAGAANNGFTPRFTPPTPVAPSRVTDMPRFAPVPSDRPAPSISVPPSPDRTLIGPTVGPRSDARDRTDMKDRTISDRKDDDRRQGSSRRGR